MTAEGSGRALFMIGMKVVSADEAAVAVLTAVDTREALRAGTGFEGLSI